MVYNINLKVPLEGKSSLSRNHQIKYNFYQNLMKGEDIKFMSNCRLV